MKIPSLSETHSLILDSEKRNPGPWVKHSFFTANAADAIAGCLPSLDQQTAFIFGYLHDIGRREGVTDMRHILDGYNFLARQGFEDAARICITHSFPVKNFHAVEGQWDCSPTELEFIEDFLGHMEYNEYDRLIQLCDALALPSGFCLIEKRFVQVAFRHGTTEYTIPRWKAYLQLQNDFEKALGTSLYDLLPGVVENTFSVNLLST
jgi:hypothetical protein